MSDMELQARDTDEVMSDAESEGSYNLSRLFAGLDIVIPTDNELQRRRRAQRLAAGHEDTLEMIYNQLSEYEKEIDTSHRRTRQLEIEARTLREILSKERGIGKRNKLYIRDAEQRISDLKAALEENQRKAAQERKVLESKLKQQTERTRELMTFIHGIWADLQEREEQLAEDGEDRSRFRAEVRDFARRSEEQKLQLRDGIERMERLMRATNTKTDSRNRPTGSKSRGAWGLLNSGGSNMSLGAPSEKSLTWTGPVKAPSQAGEGSKAVKPVEKPRFNLLERSKYLDPSRADSYTMSPAFSDFIEDSPLTENKRFSFKTASSEKRPLALELGLDSRDDLEYLDTSNPPTPRTYPTNLSRRVSMDTDSGSTLVGTTGEDDDYNSFGTSSMQLVPRKRIRLTSSDPEAEVIEGNDDEATSPSKRTRTNRPPSGEFEFRQAGREFPPRDSAENNSKQNFTASRATQVYEDSLQPIPRPRPRQPPRSILHRYLEDLPFRSFQTQAEWKRQVSLPISLLEEKPTGKESTIENPPVEKPTVEQPLVTVPVTNQEQENISKQARELPKTLTMPGEWPSRIISEAALNETEIHPLGHVVDSAIKWVIKVVDERPQELACGIFAIGSLFWLWQGHQLHQEWLSANEVPLAVLVKLRHSSGSMSWTDTIRYEMMKLLNVDRVMLG